MACIAIIALAAFCLVSRRLDHPGLDYDELLFVNGALNRGVSELFIVWKWHGVPILLMDYIGALKAWIFHPIFAIWDVTPWSVRIPSLLIGIAGEILLILALRSLFDWRTALYAAPLLLFDPDVLMHSRLDWGPNALGYLFRGGLILSMALWIRKCQIRYLWMALVMILLGCFDKLNFLWVAMSSVAALVFFYGRQLWNAYRDRPVVHVIFAVMSGIGIAAFIVRAILVSRCIPQPPPASVLERIYQVGHLLFIAIGGGGPLDFIMGHGERLWSYLLPGYITCVISAIICLLCVVRTALSREWRFLVAVVILTILAFALTKAATGPHHAAIMAGMPAIILAPILAKLPGKWGAILGSGSVALLAGGMIFAGQKCIMEFQKPPLNRNWDPSQHEVAEFVAHHQGKTYITSDWGIATHLICTADNTTRVIESWWRFKDEKNARAYVSSLTPGVILISHKQGFNEMDNIILKNNVIRCLNMLNENKSSSIYLKN
jgi:hypothetical protein